MREKMVNIIHVHVHMCVRYSTQVGFWKDTVYTLKESVLHVYIHVIKDREESLTVSWCALISNNTCTVMFEIIDEWYTVYMSSYKKGYLDCSICRIESHHTVIVIILVLLSV